MTHVSEDALLERADKVEKAGDEYRKYAFALEIYRAKYDRILALTKAAVRKDCPQKISEAELERIALASDLWGEKLDKEHEFLECAGKAKIDFQVAMTQFDAMRSALSATKSEQKRLG